MNRTETTNLLTRIGVFWLTSAAPYSALAVEIGLPRSDQRADILSIDGKGTVRIIEVKSCRADFTSDNKWEGYLKYCDFFYLLAPKDVIKPAELPKGVGLIEPHQDGEGAIRHGWPKIVKRASRQPGPYFGDRFSILQNIAFRNSDIHIGICKQCGSEVVLKAVETGPIL